MAGLWTEFILADQAKTKEAKAEAREKAIRDENQANILARLQEGARLRAIESEKARDQELSDRELARNFQTSVMQSKAMDGKNSQENKLYLSLKEDIIQTFQDSKGTNLLGAVGHEGSEKTKGPDGIERAGKDDLTHMEYRRVTILSNQLESLVRNSPYLQKRYRHAPNATGTDILYNEGTKAMINALYNTGGPLSTEKGKGDSKGIMDKGDAKTGKKAANALWDTIGDYKKGSKAGEGNNVGTREYNTPQRSLLEDLGVYDFLGIPATDPNEDPLEFNNLKKTKKPPTDPNEDPLEFNNLKKTKKPPSNDGFVNLGRSGL